MQLDSLDRKILYYLDHNGRASASAIARKVTRGRDTVEYRIQRLRKAGIITSTHAMVNPAALGLTVYKTYLRLRNDRERIDAFSQSLKRDARVFAVIECHGQWDLILTIPAKTAYDFSRIQGAVLQPIQDLLIESSVFVITECYEFRKKYLYQSGPHWFYLGGAPQKPNIDQLEVELLRQLTIDGTTSAVALAETTGASPAVVQYRIKRLQESGVITGFRTHIDSNVIGMSSFKCQLYTSEISLEQTHSFTEACSHHPNVTAVIHQFGSCSLEFEVQAECYREFSEVVATLRSSFQSFIVNLASIMVASEHYNYQSMVAQELRGD